MVYIAADLKYYRKAKKFNSKIPKTLMSGTHSCVFLGFHFLQIVYLIQSYLIYVSRKRIPEKNDFICFDLIDFQFKKTTMQFYDQFFQKKDFLYNFCKRGVWISSEKVTHECAKAMVKRELY